VNTYYLAGLTIGGILGVYFFSIVFRYALLGGRGTKAQHIWVIFFTGVVAVGFSAFGDGTDSFTNRITNLPDMAQVIAYGLSTLVVASFVWLRWDTNAQSERPPVKAASDIGRAIALVFVLPMSLLGLGNLAGSAYSSAVRVQPTSGLGVDRAEMREMMLTGEMAPFWQLIDQKAPAHLDYIIDRIFSDEKSYKSGEDVLRRLNEELLGYRVRMAAYAPALTDRQRSLLIRSQADFLRAFQNDPKTCSIVADQGGAGLSQQQLSSVGSVFNKSMATMMGLLIDAQAAARGDAVMPKPPTEDDYAILFRRMIETGTTERELFVIFNQQNDDPAYCKANIAFLDTLVELPNPSGTALRHEITQNLLTAQ
jgi:hypothetical protein